jgi:hypothetical protein
VLGGCRRRVLQVLVAASAASCLAGASAMQARAAVRLGPVTQVLPPSASSDWTDAISPHGRTILLGNTVTHEVLVWRSDEPGSRVKLRVDGGKAVRVSDDGRLAAFACGRDEQSFCLWRNGRTSDRISVARFCPRHGYVISLALSADWQTLVVTCEVALGTSDGVVVVRLRGSSGQRVAELDGFDLEAVSGDGARLLLVRPATSSVWLYARRALKQLAATGWYGPSENALYAGVFGSDGEGQVYDTRTGGVVASGFRAWLEAGVNPICEMSAECIAPGAEISNDATRLYFNARWGGSWPIGPAGDEGTYVADLRSREVVEVDPAVFERTSARYRHSFPAGVSASGTTVVYGVAETGRNGVFASYYARSVH